MLQERGQEFVLLKDIHFPMLIFSESLLHLPPTPSLWMPEQNPRSSGRASSALSHRAISPLDCHLNEYCSSNIPTLLCETEFLIGLELTKLVWLVGWPASPSHPPVSTSTALRFEAHTTASSFFTLFSCLCGKHLTHWAPCPNRQPIVFEEISCQTVRSNQKDGCRGL